MSASLLRLINGAGIIFSVSGCTDHFEADEDSAIETTRNIVATLNREQWVTSSGGIILHNTV